jgi:hypothetical protein
LSKLRKLIDKITEFGINPKVDLTDKDNFLKKLLVGIYSEFLNVESEFDETEYDQEPEFDYKEIRKNVELNFPDFGYYATILDNNKFAQESEFGTGDSVDDLTDIIKDLLGVKWKFENTSEKDAIWTFELSMKAHSEQHLVDLLKYLKDKLE